MTFSPSSVDPRGPRFAAALTTVVLAVALVTGNGWVLAAQVAVFALGAAGRSPYTWVFRTFIRPRLAPPTELEDARPVRFAQSVGLAFTVVAFAGAVGGVSLLAVGATAAALAAAFLNAAFGVCLGCEVYLLLHRARTRAGSTATPSATIRTEVSA